VTRTSVVGEAELATTQPWRKVLVPVVALLLLLTVRRLDTGAETALQAQWQLLVAAELAVKEEMATTTELAVAAALAWADLAISATTQVVQVVQE
jgi:hypothetical protein